MYPPHHLGGYELIWEDAVRHLRSRGHSVRVLTTEFRRDDHADDDRTDREEDVHRELHWYWRDHQWPRFSVRDRVRLERRNAGVFERNVAEFQPDVIGWWAMGGLPLSLIERVRRQGIPAAGFVCDEWMVYGTSVDAWMRLTRRPVIGAFAGLLTGIPTRVNFSEVGPWLFLSETLRKRTTRVWGLRDTAVAHQGVDREVFTPAEPSPWRWRLLYAGRIDSRKGIDLAVRALSGLPATARLEIVGSGDSRYLEELQALAARERVMDRVRFHPGESHERLRERYAAADVLVFPVRWEEPWGLVPLEAMAVGTPVIATGRGGSGEYLEDGFNCLIFDPDRGPQALVERIDDLARDEALRARLRKGGAETSAAISANGFTLAAEATLVRAPGPRTPAR
jgi:glycogen(starch) synthase